jgi:hypothetical protein
LLLENSRLNVYAGEREVRPPRAPTINSATASAIAGLSVCRC